MLQGATWIVKLAFIYSFLHQTINVCRYAKKYRKTDRGKCKTSQLLNGDKFWHKSRPDIHFVNDCEEYWVSKCAICSDIRKKHSSTIYDDTQSRQYLTWTRRLGWMRRQKTLQIPGMQTPQSYMCVSCQPSNSAKLRWTNMRRKPVTATKAFH